jgi:flagellar hook-associated protein 2
VTTAPSAPLSLTGNGTTVAIDPGGSLSTLASAINAQTQKTGVQAQLVHSTKGDVLLLNSTGTGSAASFTLTDGGPTPLAAGTGTDALVTINGTTQVRSSSNTFTNLMPGIDVTLGADAAPTTTTAISVAADGASRGTAMKAFIGQLNDVLDQLAATTSYGTITAGQASAGGGALPGDPTLRAVADQLVTTIFPGGSATLATYGIGLDRTGRFTFDTDAFAKAYAADPAGVQAAIVGANSFTDRVQKVAVRASDPYDGSISQYIKSENTEADRYADQIAAWDDRLTARQASLQQIYTNLETQLSRLQAQQSWLSSQIDSLDGVSSSSRKK